MSSPLKRVGSSMTAEQREAKRREIEERVKAMLATMESPNNKKTMDADAIENKGKQQQPKQDIAASEEKQADPSEGDKAAKVEAKKSMLKERVKSSRSLNGATTVDGSSNTSAPSADLIPVSAVEVLAPVVEKKPPVKVHPSALPSNDSVAVAQLRAKLHAAKSDAERLALAVEITNQRYPLSVEAQRERKSQFAEITASRKAKEEADRKAKEEADRKAKEEADRKAKEEAERKAEDMLPDVSVFDTVVHGVLAKKKQSVKETPEQAEERRKRTAAERAREEEEARRFREAQAKQAAEAASREAQIKSATSKNATVAADVSKTTEALAAEARAARDAERRREEEAEREAQRKALELQRAARKAAFEKAVEERTKAESVADKKAARAQSSSDRGSSENVHVVNDIFAEVKEQTDAIYAKLEAEALAKIKIDEAASERERERAAKLRQQREEERKAQQAMKSKRSSSSLKDTFVEKKVHEPKLKSNVVPHATNAGVHTVITPGVWVLIFAFIFFVLAALAR